MFRIGIYPTLIICSFLAACGSPRYTQEKTRLDKLINSAPRIRQLLDSFSDYESQLIYIQIDRDKNQKPHFKTYSWNQTNAH